MHPTCPRVRLSAVVLTSCFALWGSEGAAQVASANGWRYAQTIGIDTTAAGANVPEDVASYPLAVLLDKSRFDFGQARADGADIRFVDAAGKTASELERHIYLALKTAEYFVDPKVTVNIIRFRDLRANEWPRR